MSATTKTADDLRARLFAAIDGVADKSMSIDQAKTIGELSQAVVNLVRAENEYKKLNDTYRNRFLDAGNSVTTVPLLAPGNGINGITRHLLQDD